MAADVNQCNLSLGVVTVDGAEDIDRFFQQCGSSRAHESSVMGNPTLSAH